MPIIYNSLGSSKVTTLDIGNSSYTTSNLSANILTEVVQKMGVAYIAWTGDWEIKQGANIMFRSSPASSGVWNLNDHGIILNGSNTSANITANSTTTNSSLVMLLSKTIISNTGLI